MPHADPDARRAYMRDWKRRNRDRLRETRANEDRARHANARAHEFGAPGVITLADVRALLAPGAACHYCGTTERLTIDHVVPLASGGENAPSNLVPCCLACNISKGNGPAPWRWAQHYDACVRCGRTASKHTGKGICNACRTAEAKARRRTTLDPNPRAC